MARINPLFGRMKGKYGGSVMYSYGGKQCMRERVLEVRNPRTSKQAIQRCIMATVNQFVTAFTPVLNNAIESETTKARNLAKIRSYNLNILRQLAANGDGAYCPKGAQFVAPNDYMISRGTLRGMVPLRDATARAWLSNNGGLSFDSNNLNIAAEATASIAFPSVQVGDQITILVSMTEDIAEGSMNAYCRFAFKNNVTPVFITNTSGDGYRLNPDAVDISKAAGPWRDLWFLTRNPSDPHSIMLSELVLDALTAIQCAGVIVSREADRKRSTSYMVSAPAIDNTLDEVYPTYMGGGTLIEMPSDVYLNNDADATIYSANLPSGLPYTVSIVDGSRRLVKLSTNVPLDINTNLSLTVRRANNSVTLSLLYSGGAVSSSDIQVTAQWLANGYLALEGTAGDVIITEGTITFDGGVINIG